MNKIQLQQIVTQNGNCVNLGRTLKVSDLNFYIWVKSTTQFLNEQAKFNERVYCILHDITAPVFDAFGKPARFVNIFKGYSIRQSFYDKITNKKVKPLPKPRPKKISKFERFIKRNRARNARLYQDDAVQGYDYVVCPVSGERLSIIKSTHITNNLNMTVEEFDGKFPGFQKKCEKRDINVKFGLRQIDPITGLSKYKLSQIKSKQTLSIVDENGISGYKKKGQKTRATHMQNVDEHGRNGYSQLATKAIINGNATKAKQGKILDPALRTEFYRYKSVVTYLTEKQRKSLSKGYKTGLAGEIDAYHIDHNYSIMEGYKNKISPLIIGHINNLRMIPWEENLSKHKSCDITTEQLFMLTSYTREDSINEFNLVINIIKTDMEQKSPVSGAKIVNIINETKISKK